MMISKNLFRLKLDITLKWCVDRLWLLCLHHEKDIKGKHFSSWSIFFTSCPVKLYAYFLVTRSVGRATRRGNKKRLWPQYQGKPENFSAKNEPLWTRMKYDFLFSSLPFPVLYLCHRYPFFVYDRYRVWMAYIAIIDSRLDGRTGNHFQDPEKPQDKGCRKSYSAVEIIINEGFRARLE